VSHRGSELCNKEKRYFTLKVTAFWDMELSSLVDVVYINETAWRCIPEGCHLHPHHPENMKSHVTFLSQNRTLVFQLVYSHFAVDNLSFGYLIG
jgi:hypothetical protein